MARIAGVDLPRNKRVDIALTYIFGIGRAKAQEILDKADVGGGIRTDDTGTGPEEDVLWLQCIFAAGPHKHERY